MNEVPLLGGGDVVSSVEEAAQVEAAEPHGDATQYIAVDLGTSANGTVMQLAGEMHSTEVSSAIQHQLDQLELELTSVMRQLNGWYPNQTPATRWPCGYAMTGRLRSQPEF